MIGYIYCCTCKNNGKRYIGQTLREYNVRWKEHKRHSQEPNCYIYNCHFYRALRKYGIDEFTWEVLETINADCRKDLQKQLDLLEISYIQKYDTYKNGYNSTSGGDHSSIEPRSVLVFSDKGILLETFDSAIEASEYYGISINTIRLNCGRFTYYSKWNNSRILFRWENDNVTEEEIEFLKTCHYDFPIDMYDLCGNLIESFPNITSAAKKFNLKNERISKSCRLESAFVQINGKRYIFRYCGDKLLDEDVNKANMIKSDPKVAVIAIDSVTGEVIGNYTSQSEAARMLDTRKNNISEALSGKRKSAGKYNGHPIKWIKPIL